MLTDPIAAAPPDNSAVKESNAQSYNRFLGFVLVRLGDDAGWQIYVDKKTGSLEMLNSCLAHGGLYFKR